MGLTPQWSQERWNTYRADPQRRRPRIVDAEGARERNEDLCHSAENQK